MKKKKEGIWYAGGRAVLKKYGRDHFVMMAKKRWAKRKKKRS
jgi:hypothetical protein